jgi:hypothetical protein
MLVTRDFLVGTIARLLRIAFSNRKAVFKAAHRVIEQSGLNLPMLMPVFASCEAWLQHFPAESRASGIIHFLSRAKGP